MSSAYNMRSGRESKGPPSADLLVCFPPRTHLALMPKPIYSPARPAGEPGTTRRHHRHARKPSNRGIFSGGIGHASPLLRAKTNSRLASNNSDIISEPTSPKVTCAGQIKISKHKPTSSCSNWQSVMEEIERLHNSRKQKKRHAWAEAFGFKKDVMQFLTCLRNIRFDFRCFGSFPNSVVDDDDDDEEEEDEYDDESEDEKFHESIDRCLKEETTQRTLDETDDLQSSKTVFSKWFMVLQEDHQGAGNEYAMNQSKVVDRGDDEDEEEEEDHGPCVPPPNALLLMRCRSAPLNKWLQEEKEEEKEREKEKERLLVMRCGEDFSKLSTDIAKETWIVGGIGTVGMLSRSRSCRR